MKLMHKKGSGVGYVIVISVEGKTIYHAGDTDLIPEMEHIRNIDVALLPIGGRDFIMDLHEAVKAARRINNNFRIIHSMKMKKAVDACTKAGIGLIAMKT